MSKRSKATTKPTPAMRRLVEAYLNDGGAGPEPEAYRAAKQQLDDLAMHEPEALWEFLILLLEGRPGLDDLVGLGAGPVTWLLRRHPDQFDERVAGLIRRDRQMWEIGIEIERERIAPDVFAKIQAALDSWYPPSSE